MNGKVRVKGGVEVERGIVDVLAQLALCTTSSHQTVQWTELQYLQKPHWKETSA